MLHSGKLRELIVYLGQHPKVENLGLTKLWKLIYFIDAKALRDLGETITGSEFIKYEHGPVPSRGEKLLKVLRREGAIETAPREMGTMTLTEVRTKRKADLSHFSADEQTIIDEVCRELGRKTAMALSNISHREPAWHYSELRGKLSPELMAYGLEEDAEGL